MTKEQKWIRAIRARLGTAWFFLLRIFMKGDEIMMAMFFAQRVILGKTTYEDVPAALKSEVRELLVDAGLIELVVVG